MDIQLHGFLRWIVHVGKLQQPEMSTCCLLHKPFYRCARILRLVQDRPAGIGFGDAVQWHLGHGQRASSPDTETTLTDMISLLG